MTPEGPSGNKGAGSDGSYMSARIYEAHVLTNEFTTDIGSAMHGVSSSAYFRLPFNVTNAAAIHGLTLQVKYDDAFIIYLNGQELTRRHVTSHVPGELRAGSQAEFSGVQGRDNWFYGYYGKTLDYDGVYDPLVDFYTGDPDWIFDGNWQLGIEGEAYVNPPWTSLSAAGGHPNGFNSFDLESWAVRRYASEFDGAAVISWHLSKSNLNCGNGVTGRIFDQEKEHVAQAIDFNDATGVDGVLVLPGIAVGDPIDFAIDPTGPDGFSVDSCDGTTFQIQVYEGQPVPSTAFSRPDQERPSLDAFTTEIFELSDVAGLLRSGDNLLAVHGINFSSVDADFLQSIELTGNLRPQLVEDMFSMEAGTSTNFSEAVLLANDQDPDGDSLSLVGVADASFQGGTLSFQNGTISYMPPTGYTGLDSFYYMASDRFGAATGRVDVSLSDTLPPIFRECPENRQLSLTPGRTEIEVDYQVRAFDAVDGEVVVACDPPSGASFGLGTTLVRCEAVDAAGHTNYCSFQVQVVADADLKIGLGEDELVLSWEDFGQGQVLEEVESLAVPILWVPVTGTNRVVNGRVEMVLPNDGSTRFFRLRPEP
jgi:hypothetical protein